MGLLCQFRSTYVSPTGMVSQKQSKKQRRISWNSFFRTRLLFSSPSVPSLRIPTSLYYCDEMGPSPLYPHYRRDFHAVAAPRID